MTQSSPAIYTIGLASDHAGFALKQTLSRKLTETGYTIEDFGNLVCDRNDDYPDYVIPLARAVTNGEIHRGIAICGSGVGACIAANKIAGVRSALTHDTFSAHQGVQDDDLNLLCLGQLVVGDALAWEIVLTFLSVQFSQEERHIRRLQKIAALETAQEME